MISISRKAFVFLLFVTILSCNAKFERVFRAKKADFARNGDYFQHAVKRGGEGTICSLSKMSNFAIEDLYRLNYGSETGIKDGSRLKIPKRSDLFFYHTIQPKETLYSISRRYQVKEEDILEINPGLSIETFIVGKTICIPSDKRDTRPSESKEVHAIKVALLLPFGLTDGTYKSDTGRHVLEYYKGMLIALRDIKANGISVDLQVLDINSGTDSLQNIFNNPCIQNVNLIIGGLTEKQIKLISDFSDDHNIPYIIPFASKGDEPLFHSNVYQINPPQLYLYTKVSAAFCSKYKDANIVFYSPNFRGNKTDFVDIVRKDLELEKIAYKVVGDANPTCSEIIKALDGNKKNVFILPDDRQNALTKLIFLLKTRKDINTRFSISFFGYPSWYAYKTNDFFRLNVAFYSTFYIDPTSQKVKSFRDNYQYWYPKDLINSYLEYGMSGYDTGMFFIQLLDKYGDSLATRINESDYSGVRNDFHFERLNDRGGLINTNLYLIEFNKDSTMSSHLISVK